MKIFRLLLFPFSILYGVLIALRNLCFNLGILEVRKHPFLVISVGNLRVGGSGKTPMSNYLISLFEKEKKMAVLSRGYGRKTKGFQWVRDSSNSGEVGEEILLLKSESSEGVVFAVSESRNVGAKKIASKGTELLVLDDAYQHRYIHRDINLLLSDFSDPFFKDLVLPSGNLRESRREAMRADAVIFTYCPEDLDEAIVKDFTERSRMYSKKGTPVFFSVSQTGLPKSMTSNQEFNSSSFVLLSGISNPLRLETSVKDFGRISRHFKFPDHHQYSSSDLKEVFDYSAKSGDAILTTGKDWIKIRENKEALEQEIFVLPQSFEFLDFGTDFDSWIRSKVNEGIQ